MRRIKRRKKHLSIKDMDKLIKWHELHKHYKTDMVLVVDKKSVLGRMVYAKLG